MSEAMRAVGGSTPMVAKNLLAALVLLLPMPPAALAASSTLTPTNAEGQIEVVLKDHKFTPSEIHVEAGKRSQILLRNQDATEDEFDSTSLKIEKVVGGGSQGVVRLRELDPGRYPFMGEFHAETAQGVVVAE